MATIYSGAPTKTLFDAVPPGDYNLYFAVSVPDGSIRLPGESTDTPLTRQIKSNEVAVSIR